MGSTPFSQVAAMEALWGKTVASTLWMDDVLTLYFTDGTQLVVKIEEGHHRMPTLLAYMVT